MDINYERLEWEDFPSTETPINADNLNHLEEGIAGLYAERYEMQSNIAYVEDGDTASKDYLPNSYLMRDGLFYKVTKTILYGDSFDSGEDGNIEHVDISSQFGSGGGGSTGCVELTQAQYDALSDEAKMLDVIYLITDSPDNYLDEVFGDFASVEYTDTASKAYAVGDYLVYDNKFYKVTSAIAQGGTIVPDTNVVKTTVGDEVGNRTKRFYITASTQMYDMHNQIPLNEAHFCVVRHDVMEARTGLNLTGHGYCVRIDDDIVDFILMAGNMEIELRVSGNTVSRRFNVGWDVGSETAITYGSGSAVYYSKIGNMIHVEAFYSVSDGSIAAWGTKKIATLPTGYRPRRTIRSRAVTDRTTSTDAFIGIQSDGAVVIAARYGTINDVNDHVQASFVYPAVY